MMRNRQQKKRSQRSNLAQIFWGSVAVASIFWGIQHIPSCSNNTHTPLTQTFQKAAAPSIDTQDYKTLLDVINQYMAAQGYGDYAPILQKHVLNPIHQVWMLRMAIYEGAGGNPKIVSGDQKFIPCMNSAAGLFQFIRDTGEGFRLLKGTKENCSFDHRQNLDQSTKAAYALMVQNIKPLKKNGLDVTFENTYMLHQQGKKGGVLLLKNPNTPILHLLSHAAVTANCPEGDCPTMKGKDFKDTHANYVNKKIEDYALNRLEMNDRSIEALAIYVQHQSNGSDQYGALIENILAKRSSHGRYGLNIVSIIEKEIGTDIDKLSKPSDKVTDFVKEHINQLITGQTKMPQNLNIEGQSPFILCQNNLCNKL